MVEIGFAKAKKNPHIIKIDQEDDIASGIGPNENEERKTTTSTIQLQLMIWLGGRWGAGGMRALRRHGWGWGGGGRALRRHG